MSELLRHVKAKLPAGFRAYLGTGPAVAVGAPPMRPDVGVRTTGGSPGAGATAAPLPAGAIEPDVEVAVAALDPAPALFVERESRLVAAVELVSPRNKDRPVARSTYLGRYAAYLIEGIHLLLVDVHPRPAGFSFAEQIGRELQMEDNPPVPPPFAMSYRVGGPAATGGRMLAMWRRPLAVGATLPELPLSLTDDAAVSVNLEQTYARAAADAYLP
jgi:hypothetical protein